MDRKPPQWSICPITLKTMTCPVVGADGRSYERTALETHLRDKGKSPVTGAAMSIRDLVENRHLKAAIEDHGPDGYRTVDVSGVPWCFICPVTRDAMTAPVIDRGSGHSYERSGIEAALKSNGRSPVTRRPMTPADLIPNRTLQDAIRAWNPERFEVAVEQKKRQRIEAEQAEVKARQERDARARAAVAPVGSPPPGEGAVRGVRSRRAGVTMSYTTAWTNAVFHVAFSDTTTISKAKQRIALERGMIAQTVQFNYQGRNVSSGTVADLILPGSSDHVVVTGKVLR
eukprot:m.108272 g.108272  ORF g.108272 m.108272 type:complete len:286 (+) comp12795_c0_seq1:71-928(+)